MINPFGMAAGWLNRGAAGAAIGSMAGGWRGAGLAIGARGARGLGTYMGALAGGNPTVWGATLGGLYGGVNDNTSVLGGALMGAGIGRYGGAGWNTMWRAAGMRGINTVRGSSTAFWRGARRQGQADWRRAYAQGRAASTFIGATARRAWNGFRSL